MNNNWIIKIFLIISLISLIFRTLTINKIETIFTEIQETKKTETIDKAITEEEILEKIGEDLNIKFTEETEAKEIEDLTKEIHISEKNIKSIKYDSFINLIETNKVKAIYYEKLATDFYIRDINNNFYITTNPQYENFKKDMLENGIYVLNRNLITLNEIDETGKSALVIILIITTFIILIACYSNAKDKENNIKVLNKKRKALVKSSNAKEITNDKKIDPNTKTFSDIAGLEEVKKDMKCLVDFIKNKDKYVEAGAKLPKGVILYGPPGTGKTLLAKAVAGEANIPFIYMSGSDFIEMYVGVGAKRVRELFTEAKKSAPCIIFIDEIDAIGGIRNQGDSSGEDRKTINALLTEMDGFNTTDNILVIGATNRLEDLDPALLRPGRFTNKYCVPLPSSVKERLEIIDIYSKNKKFAEDVDFKSLAKETIGFSPAQIESLLNEAAIISVQDNKLFIDNEAMEKAMFKILLSGHAKENQKDRDKEELKLVAYHEAGHALIGKLLGKEINKVTILSSTSGAGGVTFSTPSKMGLKSVEDLKNEVKELYGGRCAEFILYNKNKEKVTTGASNDIERATGIIKEIISTYGMTDSFGLLNLTKLKIDDKIIIEEEIKLAKQLEQETLDLLNKNKDKLIKIAENLLEKETLYEKDLDEIINKIKEKK